jgi:TolB-like protein/tRNA A-37 threonylcarbamoyl transferase component Bud32/Tfp pilus assembly protein PilF
VTDALGRLSAALADRYVIERELGAGGMATVYLAHDVRHDRKVALKVLRPELSAALGAERFLAEIKTTARLRHPHILPLFDSGEAGGALYYVMPLVDGESLRARLERERPLPLAEALRITREVADALAYAHGCGVVHRDIKPENILLEGGHALASDFGIARAIDAAGDVRLTETGQSLGTPLYMSPEQSAGDTMIDGRSDLYSLASVLFEMLTGAPPFAGATAQAILVQRFTQPAPRISATRMDVPAAVDAAVHRALARDPDDRQPTIERFAEALADGPAPSAGGKSIAVLPFENMSADPKDAYFGDGMAEEIINVLTQVDGLRVAARTSAFSFKGKQEDLRVIGDKLNVATVLEGSVRRAGNRMRITAQLISVADGYHLWSERYDRDLTDVFAVQDEIASAIAAKLQVTYVKPPAGEAARPTTTQLEAYELYLKGRALANKRGTAIRDAIGCFEKAIALDPAVAHAYAGLGEGLRILAQYGFAPPADAIPRAKAALARALELDPDLGEALGTSGLIALNADADPVTAFRLWERALTVNPRLSELRCLYAIWGLVILRGEDDRGEAEMRRAIADDPLSAICAAHAALGLAVLGRHQAAAIEAARAFELDPGAFASHLARTWVAALGGDLEGALAMSEPALQMSGRHPWILAVVAAVHAARGDRARAEAFHQELLARAVSGSVQSVWLALSALALGRNDEAMDHAMRSVQQREAFGPWFVRWPGTEALHAHPRYVELRRLAGL